MVAYCSLSSPSSRSSVGSRKGGGGSSRMMATWENEDEGDWEEEVDDLLDWVDAL